MTYEQFLEYVNWPDEMGWICVLCGGEFRQTSGEAPSRLLHEALLDHWRLNH